jgi:hypothetical protein
MEVVFLPNADTFPEVLRMLVKIFDYVFIPPKSASLDNALYRVSIKQNVL